LKREIPEARSFHIDAEQPETQQIAEEEIQIH
jgi:hypothetical protein